MSLRFVHPRDADQIGAQQASIADGWQSTPTPVDVQAIIRAERACCCTARPSVLVIMPPTPGRPYHTDLLLCWHHYRASLRSLAAAGATVLGGDGERVPDADWPALQQA